MAGAVIAAAVSFWQIKWCAGLVGIPDIASWGFPLIVDGIGTVMAALTMSVHSAPFRQRLYVWSFFLVFIGISLFCNALHATVYVAAHPLQLPGQLAGARWGIVFLLAAIPPVGAAIGMHAFAFTRRHGVGADLRASAADTRTLTDVHARARTPETPSSAVHAPQPARARTPRPVQAAPAQARTDAVTGEDARWERLMADPDSRRAWQVYQELRTATGVRPSPSAVHERAGVQRDRSTVSRWCTAFGVHWDAHTPVHAHDAHGARGQATVAHASNGSAPAG